jgi:hypothetical protein
MTHPATKKRGADPQVPEKRETPHDAAERKLEQGLEETMAGSDPVSVTQPAPGKPAQREEDTEGDDAEGSDND